MGGYASREVVRRRIVAALTKLDQTSDPHVQVALPLPYANVTVYRNGMVLVTETGMRVFSLEVAW